MEGELRLHDVVRFLQLLRVPNIQTSPDKQWVRSSCPLAPITHSGRSDANPSFNIRVNGDGISWYNCFSCGYGSTYHLIHKLTWTVGINPLVHSFFMDKEIAFSDRESPLVFTEMFSEQTVDYAQIVPEPVPDYVLHRFPLMEEAKSKEAEFARKWIERRGISLEVAYEYNLRLNEEQNSILFPITDFSHKGEEVYLLHNRPRLSKAFWYLTPNNLRLGKGINWGRRDSWFGLTKVDFKKPVILVESETDVMRLRTLGIKNVMASCGGVGGPKLNRVESDLTYLGYDSDAQGARYCLKSIRHLHDRSALVRLSWNAAGIGDAGELPDMDAFEKVFLSRKHISVENGKIHIFPKGNLNYPEKYASRARGGDSRRLGAA